MAINRLTKSAAAAAQTANAAQTIAQRLGVQAPVVAAAAKADQPKAEYWLNVGFATQDAQYPFISLPLGIPLDNLEPTPLRGQNQEYLEFVGTKNALLDAVLEKAATLNPGDEVTVDLQVQIRRVKGEQDMAAPNTGKFVLPKL